MEELLDEEDVVQECKALNGRLVALYVRQERSTWNANDDEGRERNRTSVVEIHGRV